MKQSILFTVLFTIQAISLCRGFISVNTASRPSARTHHSDSSLKLLPYTFSVVSTAVANKQDIATASRFDTELISTYSDVQRPVFSFTDSSNVLTPAVEGVRQVIDDAKSAVSNVAQTASKLGVSFGLSYSLLSNINGAITLSISWYMTCQKTGSSPVYQWKALLKSYGTMYAFLQALKPLRVAAAIPLATHTQRWLDATQNRFQCGRSKAVMLQYGFGYMVQALVASIGIAVASSASGVPLLASP